MLVFTVRNYRGNLGNSSDKNVVCFVRWSVCPTHGQVSRLPHPRADVVALASLRSLWGRYVKELWFFPFWKKPVAFSLPSPAFPLHPRVRPLAACRARYASPSASVPATRRRPGGLFAFPVAVEFF